MNLTFVSWRVTLDDAPPDKCLDRHQTRRGLEAAFDDPTTATAVARMLAHLEPDDSEQLARVPDWLADVEELPTHREHVVLRVAEETDTHLIADRARTPPTADESVVEAGHWLLPKVAVDVYGWRGGSPTVECWNCGAVVVGSQPVRIAGPRPFVHPETDTEREELLCDDCAAELVDPDTVSERGETCADCGEASPTCAPREDDASDACRWLCADCAASRNEAVRDGDHDAESSLTA